MSAMPTLAERYELCAAEVTLDGQRAKISGARNDFATVSIVASGLSCEWSWQAAARIVTKGGDFRS